MGNIQAEKLICYLEVDRLEWLEAKANDERSRGFSAAAKRDREETMAALNGHLEELFLAVGNTAVHHT